MQSRTAHAIKLSKSVPQGCVLSPMHFAFKHDSSFKLKRLLFRVSSFIKFSNETSMKDVNMKKEIKPLVSQRVFS